MMNSSNQGLTRAGGAAPPLALPDKLGQPAQRALANAGYTRLEQLAAVGEAEIAPPHGIELNALTKLHQALAARSHVPTLPQREGGRRSGGEGLSRDATSATRPP